MRGRGRVRSGRRLGGLVGPGQRHGVPAPAPAARRAPARSTRVAGLLPTGFTPPIVVRDGGPVALRTGVTPAGCQRDVVVYRAPGPLPDSPHLRPGNGSCPTPAQRWTWRAGMSRSGDRTCPWTSFATGSESATSGRLPGGRWENYRSRPGGCQHPADLHRYGKDAGQSRCACNQKFPRNRFGHGVSDRRTEASRCPPGSP